MRKDEDLTTTEEFWAWNDAWYCAGRDPSNSGTFCPEYLDSQTDARVEQWRFDRILFRSQDHWRQPEAEGEEAVRIATVKFCDSSFAVDFNAAPSDHAFVQASFAVLAVTAINLFQDELKRKFRLWGGKEKPTFGEGRRGGIPALVVINEAGEEVKYLDAESKGAGALGEW
eukprot:s2998_g2.t1